MDAGSASGSRPTECPLALQELVLVIFEGRKAQSNDIHFQTHSELRVVVKDTN